MTVETAVKSKLTPQKHIYYGQNIHILHSHWFNNLDILFFLGGVDTLRLMVHGPGIVVPSDWWMLGKNLGPAETHPD